MTTDKLVEAGGEVERVEGTDSVEKLFPLEAEKLLEGQKAFPELTTQRPDLTYAGA